MLKSNVKINDIEGEVIAIDNICFTVKTSDGNVVLPIKEIVDNIIEDIKVIVA